MMFAAVKGVKTEASQLMGLLKAGNQID